MSRPGLLSSWVAAERWGGWWLVAGCLSCLPTSHHDWSIVPHILRAHSNTWKHQQPGPVFHPLSSDTFFQSSWSTLCYEMRPWWSIRAIPLIFMLSSLPGGGHVCQPIEIRITSVGLSKASAAAQKTDLIRILYNPSRHVVRVVRVFLMRIGFDEHHCQAGWVCSTK